MTKDQRRALDLARERLKLGKAYMICVALTQVSQDYPNLTLACQQLEDWVMKQLECDSLGTWQKTRGINHPIIERVQDRINWISWMLGEL